MQVKWFRGVDHNTPIDQIKNMYLALVKKHHPDCGGSTEDMAEINAEWDYLKTHHYNIHTSASGSVYTDEKQDVPDWATAHYPDIVVTLLKMGLDVEICGSWIWISGRTWEHVDELKQMGARYASRKKRWFIGEGKRSRFHYSMNKIRDMYGTSGVIAGDGEHEGEQGRLQITA